MTPAEIANMSGAVSRPTAQALAATAGVPGHGVRRGISHDTGRRMATALSAGLLNAVSARAIAADPDAVLAALQQMGDLVQEIKASREVPSGTAAA
ncbi:hypothetical protein [Streptomyces sp. NPDC048623]|uniref:hypothetical protein n=1 Tax=Streptomyces sp. NPDC048623 TaxID=3155761 RepID=UPI00342EC709